MYNMGGFCYVCFQFIYRLNTGKISYALQNSFIYQVHIYR